MDNQSFVSELVQKYYERLRAGNIHWYESNNNLTAPTFVASIDGVLARVNLDLNLTKEDIRAEARSIYVSLSLPDRTSALRAFSRIKDGYYPANAVALETKVKMKEEKMPLGLEKIEPISGYLLDAKPSCWRGPLPIMREAIDTLDLAEGHLLVMGITIPDTLFLRFEKDSSYQITHRVKGSRGEILSYSHIVDGALE